MKNLYLSSSIKDILKYLVQDILKNDLMHLKLGTCENKKPYILGVTGSVAVGKSTMSHKLKLGLQNYFTKKNVSVVTTDSFLFSNEILSSLGLMKHKGFPDTYDIRKLIDFFLKIQSGISNIVIPVYSHFFQNVVLNSNKMIENSDIFIIEGLHILNPSFYMTKKRNSFLLSKFFNCSIYIDADDLFLKEWYLSRFLYLRKMSKFYPDSFFNFYYKMSLNDAINVASKTWYEVNYKNLKKNIFLTQEYADFIVIKDFNHDINCIKIVN
ncbi:MAG: type I pantothenate kinase [Buchnera aphidicola (Nurudea shiraii)]